MQGRMPKSAWTGAVTRTLWIVALATLLSLAIGTTIMETFSDGLSGPGLAATILLPILIGGPMSLRHQLLLARLRHANEQLQVLASTDWLTACLNRRAFTTAVTERLETPGALLVIDADNFKVINDRHGHDRGDEVLRIMAAAIRKSVRKDDIVGRLGGEEFGVFLAGATLDQARNLADHIRSSVAALHFAPAGIHVPLTVSIGGAAFDDIVGFSELFRVADQRLYGVKQAGRNRADVGAVTDDPRVFVQALAS